MASEGGKTSRDLNPPPSPSNDHPKPRCILILCALSFGVERTLRCCFVGLQLRSAQTSADFNQTPDNECSYAARARGRRCSRAFAPSPQRCRSSGNGGRTGHWVGAGSPTPPPAQRRRRTGAAPRPHPAGKRRPHPRPACSCRGAGAAQQQRRRRTPAVCKNIWMLTPRPGSTYCISKCESNGLIDHAIRVIQVAMPVALSHAIHPRLIRRLKLGFGYSGMLTSPSRREKILFEVQIVKHLSQR
jgi:hypothetical protein